MQNIKKISTLLILIFVIATSYSQQKKDFNGWEFLNWKMSKDNVEKVLIENKNNLSSPTALDANFKYKEMNTWLFYNSSNQLAKVHQRKVFSVNQSNESEKFYTLIKTEFINDYGNPSKNEINKKDSLIIMLWELKYTKIVFEYNYKYKIIDEFGADSYWVDILFEIK